MQCLKIVPEVGVALIFQNLVDKTGTTNFLRLYKTMSVKKRTTFI